MDFQCGKLSVPVSVGVDEFEEADVQDIPDDLAQRSHFAPRISPLGEETGEYKPRL
jgi:hypothetical protein